MIPNGVCKEYHYYRYDADEWTQALTVLPTCCSMRPFKRERPETRACRCFERF